VGFHRKEYERLRGELERAGEQSALPKDSLAKPPLDDFIVRLRLG
jgi:hypothetical protein